MQTGCCAADVQRRAFRYAHRAAGVTTKCSRLAGIYRDVVRLSGTFNQRRALIAVSPIERQRAGRIMGTTGDFQVARARDIANRREVVRIQIEHCIRARCPQGESALSGEIRAQL